MSDKRGVQESPSIVPFNDKSMISNPTPAKSKNLNQSREQVQPGTHGPGYQVKVIRRDLAHEERKRKRKLKKAILNLQSQDKHRDIDYKMDGHVIEAKNNTVNFNLQPDDFTETDYDSELESPSKQRAKSAGKVEVPKSREKCLAILVEAVHVLDVAKTMKKDLNERTQILKKKFLEDKQTRIQIENELSKILVQDLEEVRDLNVHLRERLATVEAERDILEQRLINVK